jgi:tetratricopeptide (TPR) repeat protein
MNREGTDKSQAADNLANIGNIYIAQNNYTKALEYYRNALAINEETGDKAAIGNCFGNLGVVYTWLGNSDSALKYYQAALNIAREIGDDDGVGVNLCNLGGIYRDNGNYSKALEYYFKALPILKNAGDQRFIISSYIHIGNGFFNQKNYKLAKAYLDSALDLSLRISEKDQMKLIYLNMSMLDSASGNLNKWLEDYKKYIVWRDSAVNQESVKKITRMEVSFEYQRREDSISAVQERANIIRTAEISRKNIITYSSIVIEILTAILAILFINRQQIRRKRDKLLYEKEKQRMEDELNNAKIMLDEYLKNMVEKNELLEQFKTDVEDLKKLKAKEIAEARIENIEILNKTTILTEEDWNKFKELFEQVHKGFFIRLKEKLPDLTQAEIRLVCLSKLKLDTKQMAGILGVSTDTIKKTRYRLRKKLGLSGEDNIEEIDISA